MKTIAYSEVPPTHSYVHLAYLSASSGASEGALAAGGLSAISFLLMLLAGAAVKLDVRFPRAWRLMKITAVTVTGGLGLFGLVFDQALAGR